jgi:hypothetical protein
MTARGKAAPTLVAIAGISHYYDAAISRPQLQRLVSSSEQA